MIGRKIFSCTLDKRYLIFYPGSKTLDLRYLIFYPWSEILILLMLSRMCFLLDVFKLTGMVLKSRHCYVASQRIQILLGAFKNAVFNIE